MKNSFKIKHLLMSLAIILFVGVFFMYIDEYSFKYFWNVEMKGVYFFSAALGFIYVAVVGFGCVVLIPYLLYKYVFKYPIRFIVKLLNYPLIN